MYNFSAVLLSLYTSKGSILLARAAICYFWVINSSGASLPTDSEFISKFMKGLGVQKKKFKVVKKVYPISYREQLFFGVCKGRKFSDLSFVKQRLICMLILNFSSFTRFEEI